ncbi:MAG TPA: aminodeoxychorismate synthase component I [Candidatus Tripitaka californicus]|uniref:aminodeoxychorismate synthase component I n=1 Tax=Candidatus Tripitaka californicus TaxID=3367616 RepID=UPI004027A5E4
MLSTTYYPLSAPGGEVTAIEISPHCDTVTAFQRLLGEHPQHLFFLDSALRQHGLSRYSLLGCQPFLVLRSKGSNITVEDGTGVPQEREGNPFEVLRSYLRTFSVGASASGGWVAPGESEVALPPICRTGVAVGYLGYDLHHFLERLPKNAIDDLEFPDMYFGFYDKFVVYDHREGRCFLVGRNLGDDVQEFTALLCAPGVGATRRVAPTKGKRCQIKGNFTKRGYLEAIRQAKEYIARGDIYQVNLSQRFQTELDCAPHELYLRLREINPAPFSAYLQFGDNVIISSSPERFLKVEAVAPQASRRVQTCPIKGTRPRGINPSSDQRLMEELLHSTKDNAELTMIVDLERNDLGKVCNYGSVKVLEKKRLEAHPTVFHLVATVEGDLYPQYDLIDLLKATFPGGSVTGAPKIRAMEIIDELEHTTRNVYTGAIGHIGIDGSMDLAIAIRTFLIKGHSASFQAGGGIVADSRPEEEYQETLFKSRALVESLAYGYRGQDA